MFIYCCKFKELYSAIIFSYHREGRYLEPGANRGCSWNSFFIRDVPQHILSQMFFYSIDLVFNVFFSETCSSGKRVNFVAGNRCWSSCLLSIIFNNCWLSLLVTTFLHCSQLIPLCFVLSNIHIKQIQKTLSVLAFWNVFSVFRFLTENYHFSRS